MTNAAEALRALLEQAQSALAALEMSPRPSPTYRRVHGPYAHGRRWRLLLIHLDGRQEPRGYPTRERAEASAEVLRQSCGHGAPGGGTGAKATVGSALEDYLVAGREGWREGSAKTIERRLRAVLEPLLGKPLAQLEPAQVTARLAALAAPPTSWAVDTRAGALTHLRTFEAWCASPGGGKLIPGPLPRFTQGVVVVGRRRRGKPQLTTDQAKAFLGYCLPLAWEDPGAVVGALELVSGARVSELVDREVQDLDCGGTVLLIRDGKTLNAKRRFRIPPALQPVVARWAEGKPPDGRLFGISRQQAWYRIRQLCALAGVPVVTPHGLRGTNSTLRVQLDEAPAAIAKALGHGSFETTAAHYVHVDTREAMGLERALDALGLPHPNPPNPPPDPSGDAE